VLLAVEVPGRDGDDQAGRHHEAGEDGVREGRERDRIGQELADVRELCAALASLIRNAIGFCMNAFAARMK
jgi:hypothetical protein